MGGMGYLRKIESIRPYALETRLSKLRRDHRWKTSAACIPCLTPSRLSCPFRGNPHRTSQHNFRAEGTACMPPCSKSGHDGWPVGCGTEFVYFLEKPGRDRTLLLWNRWDRPSPFVVCRASINHDGLHPQTSASLDSRGDRCFRDVATCRLPCASSRDSVHGAMWPHSLPSARRATRPRTIRSRLVAGFASRLRSCERSPLW